MGRAWRATRRGARTEEESTESTDSGRGKQRKAQESNPDCFPRARSCFPSLLSSCHAMDAYQDLAVSPLQPRVAPGGGAAVESADGDDGTGLSDGPRRGLEDILLSPPSGQAEQLDDNDSPSGSSLDDSPAGVHVSSRGPGRGRHTRTAGMSKRRSWRTVIHDHMHSLPRLLTTSSCSPSCRGCDPASWVTLGLLLSCACTSFGEVVQDVNWQEPYDWDQVQRKLSPHECTPRA